MENIYGMPDDEIHVLLRLIVKQPKESVAMYIGKNHKYWADREIA